MTREQVIEKTLAEAGRCWCWDDVTESSDGASYPALVIAEHDRTLPDGAIKTCGCFGHLNAACCDTCHPHYPHRQMSLIDLPDGCKAWVCHEIGRAIYSERSDLRHPRQRNSLGGRSHRRQSRTARGD